MESATGLKNKEQHRKKEKKVKKAKKKFLDQEGHPYLSCRQTSHPFLGLRARRGHGTNRGRSSACAQGV